jgi:hypothetical protein
VTIGAGGSAGLGQRSSTGGNGGVGGSGYAILEVYM